MRHPVFRKLAYSGTHSKVSVFITSQSYMDIPIGVRKNVHSLVLFSGVTKTEIERFCDEHQTAHLNKKDFCQMVEYSISKPYDFLFYNRKHPDKKKAFRRNFYNLLNIK